MFLFHFLGNVSSVQLTSFFPPVSSESGTYNYMCTRNNNFSNRSQKGQIISS